MSRTRPLAFPEKTQIFFQENSFWDAPEDSGGLRWAIPASVGHCAEKNPGSAILGEIVRLKISISYILLSVFHIKIKYIFIPSLRRVTRWVHFEVFLPLTHAPREWWAISFVNVEWRSRFRLKMITSALGVTDANGLRTAMSASRHPSKCLLILGNACHNSSVERYSLLKPT